jgi:outer membrane protein OmpA-like peptidoglycan-associated protein
MRHFGPAAGLFAASLVFSSASWSQGTPSSDQIINALRPTPQMLSGATRGIRAPTPVTTPPGAAPAKSNIEPAASVRPMPAAPAKTSLPSISLVVEFQTGSAELSPRAIDVLTQLGRALTDPALAAYKFKIEGHTDTVGTDELNQSLSERRAEAVATYLISKFGVASVRLEPVGMGSKDPVVVTPDQTPEPRNRRVQIINLGA